MWNTKKKLELSYWITSKQTDLFLNGADNFS